MMNVLFLITMAVGFWEHSPGLILCSLLALLTFDNVR